MHFTTNCHYNAPPSPDLLSLSSHLTTLQNCSSLRKSNFVFCNKNNFFNDFNNSLKEYIYKSDCNAFISADHQLMAF